MIRKLEPQDFSRVEIRMRDELVGLAGAIMRFLVVLYDWRMSVGDRVVGASDLAGFVDVFVYKIASEAIVIEFKRDVVRVSSTVDFSVQDIEWLDPFLLDKIVVAVDNYMDKWIDL